MQAGDLYLYAVTCCSFLIVVKRILKNWVIRIQQV